MPASRPIVPICWFTMPVTVPSRLVPRRNRVESSVEKHYPSRLHGMNHYTPRSGSVESGHCFGQLFVLHSPIPSSPVTAVHAPAIGAAPATSPQKRETGMGGWDKQVSEFVLRTRKSQTTSATVELRSSKRSAALAHRKENAFQTNSSASSEGNLPPKALSLAPHYASDMAKRGEKG